MAQTVLFVICIVVAIILAVVVILESRERTAVPEAAKPVVSLAVKNLAGRLMVPAREIRVVEVQAVTWPDTSLGCPKPGMMYAQVLTPGYLIRLKAEGRVWEYHADSRRQLVILCDK